MSKIFLITGFLLLALHRLPAQQVEAALSKMASDDPEEQVYLHYDKEYYFAGETIWFKAYFYSNGLPSNRSFNFYLQLLDDKGAVISRKQYPLQGAIVKGNIELPDSLYQGYYQVRALTKTMLNSLSGTTYAKNIFVFNPGRQQPVMPAALNERALNIDFLPESGNLIDSIPTTIAFKATDPDGYPVEVSGVIRAAGDTTAIRFKSFHDGMGRIQLIPRAGLKYMAVVDGYEGNNSFPLPEVRTSGISLSVENEPGGKVFLISRSTVEKEKYQQVLLIARINDKVVYENTIGFEDFLSVRGHLSTDSLPSGILHFTVFNMHYMPLAERLSFVNNLNGYNTGDIRLIRQGKEKSSPNRIRINFPDATPRSYSVSVTDYAGTGFPDRENIYSRLLLTGELKGHVFNPAWYFSDRSEKALMALDLVMLTHGWNRFNWTKVLANEFHTKKFEEEYLMTIRGNVLHEKSKKPVRGGTLNVMLSTEDSLLYAYQVIVDDTGAFRVDSLQIAGKTKIFYTYLNTTGKSEQVELITFQKMHDKDIEETLSELKMPANSMRPPVSLPIEVAREQFDFVKAGNTDAKILENVTLKSVNKRPVDIVNEKYTSEIFRNGGRVVIDNINNKVVEKGMNGFDYVKNRISGVRVGNGMFLIRGNPAGLFIDEMPATFSQLNILRAEQIAMVKVFSSGFFGGTSDYTGAAIAVYRKTYDDAVSNVKSPSKYVMYEGYSITKEFYNPDYAKDAKTTFTDRRTTLFWNPEAGGTDHTDTYQFSFYNNDMSTAYRVTVEGFDAQGRLIFIEKIIPVEERQ